MTTIHRYMVAGLLCLLCAFTACKKDRVSPGELDFDIRNAQDYYIYLKTVSDLQGTQHALVDFKPDQRIVVQTAQYEITTPYTINDNNTRIAAANQLMEIVVENGQVLDVIAPNVTISDITVIKKSEVSSPVDRLFTGRYLRADGSILHRNFFYRFVGDNKYQVGLHLGNVVRTETYHPIGNIGAWVINVSDNGSHRELLLYINGTLKVTYMESDQKFHHGSFSEAPD